MKVKFATEKSAYSHALRDAINTQLNKVTRDNAVRTLKKIEDNIKSQGDEIIWIITTRDTNPMKDATAPPMDKENVIVCFQCHALIEDEMIILVSNLGDGGGVGSPRCEKCWKKEHPDEEPARVMRKLV